MSTHSQSNLYPQQEAKSSTMQNERVFVDLDAVYPDSSDASLEMSFEELRARARGWLERDWAPQVKSPATQRSRQDLSPQSSSLLVTKPLSPAGAVIAENSRDTSSEYQIPIETTIAVDLPREGKMTRPKKVKMKEVKGETQTGALRLSFFAMSANKSSQNEP